jgi:putative hemolysin
VIVELYILVAACFLILAGFFSGLETGIYVLDPLRYHVRLKQKEKEAGLLERLLRRKSELVTSLLVGTNLSIFLATTFATEMTRHYCPSSGPAAVALVTTAYTTTAVLIFAEMLPKNIYRRRANTLVYSSVRAFWVFSLLFFPLVRALSVITRAVSFVFGRHRTLENEFLTRKAVEYQLTELHGGSTLTASQSKMVQNIMQLPARTVTSAMIPLKDTIMVDESAGRDAVLDLVRKYRFSRMPVYREKRGSVTGVLNVFDLFYERSGAGGKGEGETPGLKRLIRPLPSGPRSARIDEALVILRGARQPMGLVVGPGKEALGIVTVKDLLEEITGEIRAW